MAIERNQTPIMKPATRWGASWVIALKPTGLRHISPIVCKKYVAVSHNGDTRTPWLASAAAGTRTTRPELTKKRPHENFAGLEGSCRSSLIQNQAKMGARITTKIAFTAWNQLAGNAKPKTLLFVLRSANRLREEPACS